MTASPLHAPMRRAIALASVRVGRTGDNPAVGCVIVKDGAIIAEAVTGEGGRPHAEEQALAIAGEAARAAQVFVTLEPCGQRSSGSSSCAQRIVEAGVREVFIACADPSSMASGRGVERLRAHGVDVNLGVLEDEARDLYAAYRPAGRSVSETGD